MRDFTSRIIHAFNRYFSVIPPPVAPEVQRASESASRAIEAAVTNAEANARLAEEMSRLDTMLRPRGN